MRLLLLNCAAGLESTPPGRPQPWVCRSGSGTLRRHHWRARLLHHPPAAAKLRELPEAAEAAAGQAAWQDSRGLLEQRLGLPPGEADLALAEAYGWGAQAYWRGTKVQEAPSAERVGEVLDFLASLGMSDADVAKVVSAFPQALGCELALLQANAETLRTKWFLKGRTLANTVVRKPQVLGSVVDCEGSCISECNRCWARF